MIFIALLKGINVGGNNIIKMSELKSQLTILGLNNVKTYIQSGNIIFESEEKKEVLNSKIENLIKNNFKIATSVIIKTFNEFEKILVNCPYSEEEINKFKSISDNECFYVAFFDQELSDNERTTLSNLHTDNESYKIIDNNIYMLFGNSIRNSKITSHIQKMKNPSTIRNWKTINKITTIMKA